jgi:hypothetical protein
MSLTAHTAVLGLDSETLQDEVWGKNKQKR